MSDPWAPPLIDLPGGMPDLPQSVLDLVEQPPAEQFVLRILRDAMPDVSIMPRIPYNALSKDGTLILPADPLVVARKSGTTSMAYSPDPRFLGEALIEVQVLASDPDGERKAALVSEACRVALRNAWHPYPTEYPGLGSVTRIDMLGNPTRRPDWATAVGPVQYADLPAGAWRFETRYRLRYRRPLS